MHRLDDFIEDCWREHNLKRALHGAPPLRHSRALDKTAQDWAEELVSEEGIKNSPLSSRGEVGESISMRTSTGAHVDIQGAEVVSQWYADEKNYNYDTGKGPAGNFTQLVWNSTREVGFGKARSAGKCIVVAHYRPPGNVLGRYLENVTRPSDKPGTDRNSNQPAVTNNDDGMMEADNSKTVITETITETNGRRYSVRREVSESMDDTGKVRRCVNEIYTDLPDTQNPDKTESTSHLDFQRQTDEFSQSIVQLHNKYRKIHGSPPLAYDQHLSKMAQEWADHLLMQSHLSNSGFVYQGLRLGENVASRWSNSVTDYTSEELVDNWYQESAKYKYNAEPETIQGIGNFSQMIWAGSERIGIGRAIHTVSSEDASTNSSKLVVVCLYYPPGNIMGQFKDNIKVPSASSKPTPTAAATTN